MLFLQIQIRTHPLAIEQNQFSFKLTNLCSPSCVHTHTYIYIDIDRCFLSIEYILYMQCIHCERTLYQITKYECVDGSSNQRMQIAIYPQNGHQFINDTSFYAFKLNFKVTLAPKQRAFKAFHIRRDFRLYGTAIYRKMQIDFSVSFLYIFFMRVYIIFSANFRINIRNRPRTLSSYKIVGISYTFVSILHALILRGGYVTHAPL